MPIYAQLTRAEKATRRIDVTPALHDELEARFLPLIQEASSKDLIRVTFIGGHQADDAELTRIENFAPSQPLLEAIDTPIAVRSIEAEEFSEISMIAFAFESANGLVGLQSFNAGQLLRRKGLALLFSGTTFSKLEGQGLTLGDRLDAVLDRATRTIEFRMLSSMRRMFDMTEHYQEATREEIASFAAHSSFQINEDSLQQSADTWIRRKISSVIKNGLHLKRTARELVDKAKEVGLQVDIVADGNGNPRIVFPANKRDQKILLKFLDDDYLESLMSSNRYITNSKRPLSQPNR